MGRSYLTVRALVLTVSCLVALEYLSLLQSAEPSGERRHRPLLRVGEGRAGEGRQRWRRHALQAVDVDKFRSHGGGGAPPPPAAGAPSPLVNLSLSNLTGPSNLTRALGPGATSSPQCPMIPPGLHGSFPVTVTDIPR